MKVLIAIWLLAIGGKVYGQVSESDNERLRSLHSFSRKREKAIKYEMERAFDLQRAKHFDQLRRRRSGMVQALMDARAELKKDTSIPDYAFNAISSITSDIEAIREWDGIDSAAVVNSIISLWKPAIEKAIKQKREQEIAEEKQRKEREIAERKKRVAREEKRKRATQKLTLRVWRRDCGIYIDCYLFYPSGIVSNYCISNLDGSAYNEETYRYSYDHEREQLTIGNSDYDVLILNDYQLVLETSWHQILTYR